jgi:hypothetical protein
VPIRAATADAQRRNAALVRLRDGESALIIGDAANPTSRFRLSSQTPGATAVESVELTEMMSFARAFDPAFDRALNGVIELAASVMTGVGEAALTTRIATIRAGHNARRPQISSNELWRFNKHPVLGQPLICSKTLRARPARTSTDQRSSGHA